jgi:hypothetical protein
MKVPAIFLLIVGCIWTLAVMWMFLSIAGIADAPESIVHVVLFWGCLLIGPAVLIIGSTFVLRGSSGRVGAALVTIGCLILTGFALYNSVVGMQRKPLQAPPVYSVYIAWLIVMLLADIAGFRLVRQLSSSQTAVR